MLNTFSKIAKTGTYMAALLVALSVLTGGISHAENIPVVSGLKTVSTNYSFDKLISRLKRAIVDNNMGLVAQASASAGASARGIQIPGNAVLMVFRNDYAVRMLKASIPAGIEAPLRIYVTENKNGTSAITYRTPSAVFSPYGNDKLNALARELDPILAKIVSEAAGKR